MAKKLTKKEKKFVATYAETGNGTQSALAAYDTDDINTAASIASENLTKPKIVNALADAIPDELLKEKHLALLNRKELITEIDPNTKEIRLKPTNQINVQAVSKGLELAYKIKGAFIEPQIPTQPGNTYNFFFKQEIRDTTSKYEEELKKILYGKE